MEMRNYYYMSASEIYDTVFYIYKKTLGRQIGYFLLANIIKFCINNAFGFIITFAAGSLIFVFSSDTQSIFLITSALYTLSYMLLNDLFLSGHIILSKQQYLGQKINFGDALSETFKKMIPVFTAAFAKLLLLIPFGAAIVLACQYCIDNVYRLDYLSGWPLFLQCLTFFAAVALPAIALDIVNTYCCFAVPAALLEKKYFFGAIAKSFQLIKNHFLKIYALIIVFRIIVAAIILSAVYFIALIGQLFLGNISSLLESNSITAVIFIFAFYLFIILFIIFTGPLMSILNSVFYFNQKIKKDGLDLAIRLNKLYARAEAERKKKNATNIY